MPNGHDMLDSAEFETWLKSIDDRTLMEFTARQSYQTCQRCAVNETRLRKLEKRGTKSYGLAGAGGAFFTGVVLTLIDIFRK